jgi:hypothetical protein
MTNIDDLSDEEYDKLVNQVTQEDNENNKYNEKNNGMSIDNLSESELKKLKKEHTNKLIKELKLARKSKRCFIIISRSDDKKNVDDSIEHMSTTTNVDNLRLSDILNLVSNSLVEISGIEKKQKKKSDKEEWS